MYRQEFRIIPLDRSDWWSQHIVNMLPQVNLEVGQLVSVVLYEKQEIARQTIVSCSRLDLIQDFMASEITLDQFKAQHHAWLHDLVDQYKKLLGLPLS